MIGIEHTFEVYLTPAAIAAAVQRGHERAMPEIGQLLADAARRTIDTGIDPWGEAWAPLDPDTKTKVGRVGFRTGAMYASIGHTPTAPTAGVTRAEVTVGATYAKYFQGARSILPLSFERKTNARGRRLKSRAEKVDLPPALLEQCVAIDFRLVQESIEEARATTEAGAAAATESHDTFIASTDDWYAD